MSQEQESGQLVVDKARVWRELNLALHLNVRDYLTRNKEHGDLVYGDKDIFRLSWLFLRTPFVMASQPVWLGRFKKRGGAESFCGRSLGQVDTNPASNRVLFVHQPARMRMPVSKLALYDFVCDNKVPSYLKDSCRPSDGGEDDVRRCVRAYPPQRSFPPSIGWLLHECRASDAGAPVTCTTTPWRSNFSSPLYSYQESVWVQGGRSGVVESDPSAAPASVSVAALAVATQYDIDKDGAPLPPMPAPDKLLPRGIVACLPAGRIADFGVLLAELRGLGCTLPVIMYHYRSEYSDADKARAGSLDDNAQLHEIVEDPRFHKMHLRYREIDPARTRGFACKPLAVMQAPFKQVMLLDYDTLFLSPPDDLFDSKAFQRTGTLFFYDRATGGVKMAKKLNRFMKRRGPKLFEEMRAESWYRGLAVVGRTEYPSSKLKSSAMWTSGVFGADSGALLVDKQRQPRMMEVLRRHYLLMMTNTYGDKETFWLAAELAGSEYAFSDFAAGLYGNRVSNGGRTYLCNGDLAHFHPDTGQLVFFHGDMIKDHFEQSSVTAVTVATARRGFEGEFKMVHGQGFAICMQSTVRDLVPGEKAAIDKRRHR